MKRKYFIALIVSWVCITLISYVWNYHFIEDSVEQLAQNKGRIIFDQVQNMRYWNSLQGGVYVPVTHDTQPNYYLKDSLRDLHSDLGLLTKINPAYMTRQLNEILEKNDNLRLHLTSIDPIRPENKANQWELKALRAFDNDATECFERIVSDSVDVFKYMAPLYVRESCLSCHGNQGYKIGDVRGGLSISFPTDSYANTINSALISMTAVHIIALIVGLFGLFAYNKKTSRYITVIQDSNIELQRKEKLLQEATEHLSRINAKKDKFFSIIAHDLKNPFMTLIGLSEMLIEEKDNIEKKDLDKLLLEFNATSVKTHELLENLLRWSMNEMNKTAFNPEPIFLKGVDGEILKLLEISAQKKNIILEEKIEPSLNVVADKNMLEVIIRNLLTNAIKYSGNNEKVIISARENESEIEIAVHDFGVGLDSHQISSLFDCENRRSTLGTGNEKGTGLGLLLCKEFVERHEGEIWVESQIRKGSSFYFSLPKK